LQFVCAKLRRQRQQEEAVQNQHVNDAKRLRWQVWDMENAPPEFFGQVLRGKVEMCVKQGPKLVDIDTDVPECLFVQHPDTLRFYWCIGRMVKDDQRIC
jgi:hypothetical protein